MYIMKKALFLFLILLCCPLSTLAQQKALPDSLKMTSWIKAGKDSLKVFYGLPVPEIINMPVERAKQFIAKRGLNISQYFTAKLEAENYLLELMIKKDSVEVMRIYERIEKLLGIKSNGNSP